MPEIYPRFLTSNTTIQIIAIACAISIEPIKNEPPAMLKAFSTAPASVKIRETKKAAKGYLKLVNMQLQ